MNFTPKLNVEPVRGILTIAVVGLIVWAISVIPGPAPIAATHQVYAVQESPQATDKVPAVEVVPLLGLQEARSGYYQPVSSWYKNKHWWKRNAPIVGGAAGGALIGGIAGGGKGALIGGAAGGGGGYLYKRLRHSHHHH
jgi:hypothetical protein